MNSEKVQCCFCGETLLWDAATQMIIYAPGEQEESQMLPCHAKCLEKAILPDIPLLALIESDED